VTGDSIPALRWGLKPVRAGSDERGEPRFLVHDPFANRFVALGRDFAGLLEAWRPGDAEAFRRHASRALRRTISRGEIESAIKFVTGQGWNQSGIGPVADQGLASRLAALADRALFLRIPLFRPQAFLRELDAILRPVTGRAGALFMALAAALAIFMVSRQWDDFRSAFPLSPTLSEAAGIAVALAFVKCIHELGHAAIATRHGVGVPVMGLAFMLFVPVLYTDTSDAWRLPDSRRRLWIDAGGILAELALAVIATLLWIGLEPGPLRTACFAVAAVSWIASLAVNLNPFMRFDGYYLLSGLLGVENLQARSFALARWRLRELLFDLRERPPELLSAGRRALLILYAVAAWSWRLALQIGISLLLYFWLTKLAGVLALAYTLARQVALPVVVELAEWRKRQSAIRSRSRSRLTLAAAVAALALLFVPLPWRVSAPAMLVSEREFRLYPGEDAMLLDHVLRDGAQVAAGETLARFHSPDLAAELRIADRRLEAALLRFRRASAAELDLLRVIESEVARARAESLALARRIATLEVRAPFAGTLADVDRLLRPGVWLARDHPMAVVVAAGEWRIDALAPERILPRIGIGTSGTFIADDPLAPSLPVRVASIAAAPAARFGRPELAAIHEGAVPVAERRTEDGEPAPKGAWFSLELQVEGTPPRGQWPHSARGAVVLAARSESLAGRFFRRFAAALIREAGF
jgi:putative peptide zinc metalloprotease protein